MVGQWKRAFSSATIVGFGTIGGVVAPCVFRAQDTPSTARGRTIHGVRGDLGDNDIGEPDFVVYVWVELPTAARGVGN